MPFVKLDQGILDSTLWVERECRDIFITALLLAEPIELREPMAQLEVREIKETGFVIPPGWYGIVRAAGVGIARRAIVEVEVAKDALEKLGAPDPESRSEDFDGRRLVRVDGGFIILNFFRYRDRDYTSADRAKRYRDRKALRRDDGASHRNITQAEAEAEVEVKTTKTRRRSPQTQLPADFKISPDVRAWAAEKGFDRLDEHLTSFKLKCAAKGYAYVDHDAAFMEAIRKDWAGLRGNGAAGSPSAPPADGKITCRGPCGRRVSSHSNYFCADCAKLPPTPPASGP